VVPQIDAVQIVMCDHGMLTDLDNVRDECCNVTVAEFIDPQIKQLHDGICPARES
jgi:hypothetical protein